MKMSSKFQKTFCIFYLMTNLQDSRALPCIGKQYKYVKYTMLAKFMINHRKDSHKDDYGLENVTMSREILGADVIPGTSGDVRVMIGWFGLCGH